MSDQGTLMAIWKKEAHGGSMSPVNEAEIETDRGMVGDANHGSRRQITIINRQSWDRVEARLGATVDPSARRANLMVSGVPLRESAGKVLEVGSVRIRIQGETLPCERMNQAHEGLREALIDEWGGGAYGEVLEGGPISTGDTVRMVEGSAVTDS